MKFYRILLFTFVAAIGCAQSKTTGSSEPAMFDEDQLLEHARVLSSDSFEGRATGERGNDSARAYIITQFKKLKVNPFNATYEQVFSFDKTGVAYEAKNILAEIRGTKFPDTYIVISAHQDHLGIRNGKIYNGADDNASGVSALFSIAEYLIENPPNHTVIFASFDAEELGLQGSKYFVDNIDKEKLLLNMNMDMISRSAKNELYVVGSRYHKSLKRHIEAFKNPTDSKLLVGHDGTDGKQDWTHSSDHGPFYKAGIPFLYFGNEDHEAYHSPTDDFNDITPKFYINAVRIILSIFNTIDVSGL